MVKQKIVVLGTGGTIAGMAETSDDRAAYVAAQKGVDELLGSLPAAPAYRGELVSEQVAQIDSKDMDLATWLRLLRRCRYWLALPEVQGLVITHGTDTLEETAYFLHALLQTDKPVVLTGAMRAANAAHADGPQNICDALTLAAHPGVRGVLVVFAGVVHAAVDVQKVHPARLDPFSSGDAGPLGQVAQGVVRQARPWPSDQGRFAPGLADRLDSMTELPRVEVVLSHAGACGATVEALVSPELARCASAAPVRGLVVAATGNGSVHQALEEALRKAQAVGVRVARATRCCEGRITPRIGQVIADMQDLSPVKARIALALELACQNG